MPSSACLDQVSSSDPSSSETSSLSLAEMALATFRFLDLPPEVRDAIYDAYVMVDGGYVVNTRTNKLVPAKGYQKHDYALQLTCRQIAREMSGLALRRNPLHFHTDYVEADRIKAARFHHIQTASHLLMTFFLETERSNFPDSQATSDTSEASDDSPTIASDPEVAADLEAVQDDSEAAPLYTQDIADEVIKEFPSMEPIFRAILDRDDLPEDSLDLIGVLPSVLLRAGWRLYGLAVKNGLIPALANAVLCTHQKKTYAVSQEFPPWFYKPSRGDFRKMMRYSGGIIRARQGNRYWGANPHVDDDGYREHTRGKYRFSAASRAISFLSKCPKEVRMLLKNIYLHEDVISVAFPECHALGLIPFCQEHPQLYIERRVNLWRTVLRMPFFGRLFQFHPENDWEEAVDVESDEDSNGGQKLDATSLTKQFGLWMAEALELVRSGMPKGSFKLVIDGNPAPELASRLFRDIIQRDATWQKLVETTNASWMRVEQDEDEQIFGYYMMKLSPWYRFDGFPDTLEAISTNDHRFIECNFDTGPSPWDPAVESKQFGYLEPSRASFFLVASSYENRPKYFFDMPDTLPAWKDLIAEEILPEFFEMEAETSSDANGNGNGAGNGNEDTDWLLLTKHHRRNLLVEESISEDSSDENESLQPSFA